jgi:hypothetical protein
MQGFLWGLSTVAALIEALIATFGIGTTNGAPQPR